MCDLSQISQYRAIASVLGASGHASPYIFLAPKAQQSQKGKANRFFEVQFLFAGHFELSARKCFNALQQIAVLGAAPCREDLSRRSL